jgi:hypothetical protein
MGMQQRLFNSFQPQRPGSAADSRKLRGMGRKRAQRGQPQPNFYHEEREGHEVWNKSAWLIFLRALRTLRGEKFFSEKSDLNYGNIKKESSEDSKRSIHSPDG